MDKFIIFLLLTTGILVTSILAYNPGYELPNEFIMDNSTRTCVTGIKLISYNIIYYMELFENQLDEFEKLYPVSVLAYPLYFRRKQQVRQKIQYVEVLYEQSLDILDEYELHKDSKASECPKSLAGILSALYSEIIYFEASTEYLLNDVQIQVLSQSSEGVLNRSHILNTANAFTAWFKIVEKTLDEKIDLAKYISRLIHSIVYRPYANKYLTPAISADRFCYRK